LRRKERGRRSIGEEGRGKGKHWGGRKGREVDWKNVFVKFFYG